MFILIILLGELHAGNDQMLREQILPVFSSFDSEGDGFAEVIVPTTLTPILTPNPNPDHNPRSPM